MRNAPPLAEIPPEHVCLRFKCSIQNKLAIALVMIFGDLYPIVHPAPCSVKQGMDWTFFMICNLCRFTFSNPDNQISCFFIKLTLDPVLQRMEKVYLLMDNLNSNFTKNIKELLSLHPQFEVIRTPIYSPELNPIERVFADLDRQAIQNHYYKDTNELEYRMDAWLTNRMKQPVKRLKPVSGKKTKKKRMKVVLKL